MTDFGFATYLCPGEKLNKGVGSRFYLAPEIVFQKSYDFKVDVWSSTAVIYSLLSG